MVHRRKPVSQPPVLLRVAIKPYQYVNTDDNSARLRFARIYNDTRITADVFRTSSSSIDYSSSGLRSQTDRLEQTRMTQRQFLKVSNRPSVGLWIIRRTDDLSMEFGQQNDVVHVRPLLGCRFV